VSVSVASQPLHFCRSAGPHLEVSRPHDPHSCVKARRGGHSCRLRASVRLGRRFLAARSGSCESLAPDSHQVIQRSWRTELRASARPAAASKLSGNLISFCRVHHEICLPCTGPSGPSSSRFAPSGALGLLWRCFKSTFGSKVSARVYGHSRHAPSASGCVHFTRRHLPKLLPHRCGKELASAVPLGIDQSGVLPADQSTVGVLRWGMPTPLTCMMLVNMASKGAAELLHELQAVKCTPGFVFAANCFQPPCPRASVF
jgi:hypothetical protein